jgi:hypothetical protein
MMGCGFIFHPHLIKDGDPFHSLLKAVLDTSASAHRRDASDNPNAPPHLCIQSQKPDF